MQNVIFVVITKVNASCGEDGNFADVFAVVKDHTLYVDCDGDNLPCAILDVDLAVIRRDDTAYEIKRIKIPVFYEGEILIVDKNTMREIAGRQRKVTKWDVEWEEFDNLNDAIERAKRLLCGP